MPRIILASASPRRKNLLIQLGFQFEVIPSSIDENIPETNPVDLVETLAFRKAAKVAGSCSNSLVIGADTIVVQDNEVLGKPENKEQAIEMLSKLSDVSHTVFTGVSLLIVDEDGKTRAEKTFHEQTKVFFSALSEHEIEQYIASGSPLDKAGAYGIQDDMGALFVKRIEGDYYNVVGFPLNRFYNEIKKFSPGLVRWDQHE